MSTKLLLSVSAVLEPLPFTGSCVCALEAAAPPGEGGVLLFEVRDPPLVPPKQQLPGKSHAERKWPGKCESVS